MARDPRPGPGNVPPPILRCGVNRTGAPVPVSAEGRGGRGRAPRPHPTPRRKDLISAHDRVDSPALHTGIFCGRTLRGWGDSMGKWLRGVAAVFLVCIIAQGCAVPPKRALSPEARDISGGRVALVVSGQGEIRPEVDASHIAMATGGGLIPALIDAAITQARMNSAEKTVRVVRDALGNYDFDKRVLE